MMLGYGAGRWTNQRRAQYISNWLEPGLRSLGGTPSVQRVSRSAFRFQIKNARQPFQTVTTSVVLISREVLPTWLWERVRGRQDLLITHVTFRHPPNMEVEIVDPGNELGQRGEAQAQALNWPATNLSSRWRLYYAPDTIPSRVQGIADQLASSPFVPFRLALRRSAPHMLLSMPMPDLDRVNSKNLADMLVKLSKLLYSPAGGRDT